MDIIEHGSYAYKHKSKFLGSNNINSALRGNFTPGYVRSVASFSSRPKLPELLNRPDAYLHLKKALVQLSIFSEFFVKERGSQSTHSEPSMKHTLACLVSLVRYG